MPTRLPCLLIMMTSLALLAGCDSDPVYESDASASGHTSPTTATRDANEAVRNIRPFEYTEDIAAANRGLLAKKDSLVVTDQKGKRVWDMDAYEFMEQEQAPASVNPSLWRQARLNNLHGLYEVMPGIYQLRGFDLANMTIIEGESGWIIVDPLTASETASAAFRFAQEHLQTKPVRAILFTHSHIDHFGGVDGILAQLSEEEKAALRIIAPEGFMEEATSENIIAGTAMSRRAMFMYGKRLARDERGHVGTGLGKGPAFGSFGIASPTELINATPTRLEIDGISFVFQFVPESEAPAEFTFYLPDYKAFCGAELVSRNLHNLYTLRGAKVRDARRWSQYIDEAAHLFPEAQVYFGSHHWPVWGETAVQKFLTQQRDTYRYIHDQTVRLMNAGHTPGEIAEVLTLPASLNTAFHNQGYYGTVKHNARAVYQYYMGWYNGNPAYLDPLPQQEEAIRTIAMMGGAQNVTEQAQKQFLEADRQSAGESTKTYRWLAQLLNKVVFADPEYQPAQQLLAKVYDQLGYQAESAPWRDIYLSGAYELRHGRPDEGINPAIMKKILLQTPVSYFFDSMAVSLNGPDAEGKRLTLLINFTDLGESYLLSLENSVLHHRIATTGTGADATLNITHPLFIDLLIGQAGLKETLFGDDLDIEGSTLDLIEFFSLFDKPQGTFAMVTP